MAEPEPEQQHRARHHARSCILDALGGGGGARWPNLARALEAAAYNAVIAGSAAAASPRSWACAAFADEYVHVAAGLAEALRADPLLRARLKRGVLAPAAAVALEAPGMGGGHPDAFHLQQEEEAASAPPAAAAAAVEGIFECHKCMSKNTVSYQRQTRSGDEAMTTFVMCLGCSHQWRFNA